MTDRRIPGSDEPSYQTGFSKARTLRRGDEFQVQVYGEVIEVAPVANGKRIKIRLALENQNQIEFTDGSCTLEFLCQPSREFHLFNWVIDDDDDDSSEVVPPAPVLPKTVE